MFRTIIIGNADGSIQLVRERTQAAIVGSKVSRGAHRRAKELKRAGITPAPTWKHVGRVNTTSLTALPVVAADWLPGVTIVPPALVPAGDRLDIEAQAAANELAALQGRAVAFGATREMSVGSLIANDYAG
jgi:hypothetical protein